MSNYRVTFRFVDDSFDAVQQTLVHVPFYETRSAGQILQDRCRVKLHILSQEPMS